MPDVRKCAIYGCMMNSRDQGDLKFFNFPARDSPWYNTWLSICHESAEKISSLRRPYICSNHFHPWHVGFRRLAMGAVPSLLLEPPAFFTEEMARFENEAAAQKEKERLLKLINDCLLKWIERAQYHPEFGSTLCTSRRELQRVGKEIRNLLGATLTFSMEDYWLRKFRRSHLSNWVFSEPNDQQIIQSLDLIEIIKSVDPDAKISNEEEIAILVEEEKRKKPTYSNGNSRFQQTKKRSFKEALEEFYGIGSNNDSHIEVKSEKIDSVDLSQDNDGCFDVNLEDSGPVVVSEPIVETYQQALEHLRPLEDFALNQENYRVIGLLSTLEDIFKNPRPV